MNDTSGPTSGRQFAYYDPDSQSWRMWPATGLWGSIAYSATWPKTGCMSDGQAFELPTSVPPTTASDFSSSRHLPTTKAHDGIMGRPRTSGRPIEKSTHLGTIVTLLPTPTSSDHKRDTNAPSDLARKSPSLTVVEKHFPTPEAKNAHAGPDYARKGRKKSGGDDLVTVITKMSTGDPTTPLFDVGSE